MNLLNKQFSFTFCLLATTCFNFLLAQNQNLKEIQNNLSLKKKSFSAHYNIAALNYKIKSDSLIDLKTKTIQYHFKTIDSLNAIKEKNQTIINNNSELLKNYNSINDFTRNSLVLLIMNPKENSQLNKITKTAYHARFLKKSNTGMLLVLSMDTIKNTITITDFTENKKVVKYYDENESKKELIQQQAIRRITKSDIVLEAQIQFNSTDSRIKQIQSDFEFKNNSLDKQIQSYNIDKFKIKRLSDSVELSKLINYYQVEYPALITNYEETLKNEKAKDQELISAYNSQLAIYNANTGYCTSMPTEDEARVYFNLFKRNLKDPYSAILETYGVKKLKKTNESYPCVKVIILGIRAKNSWGAYGASEYWIAIKDEKVIDFGDMEDWDAFSSDYYLSLALEMNSISCGNSNFIKPTYPQTAEQRISKPVMNPYNFELLKI